MRPTTLLILVFWAASMGWLTFTKLPPTTENGIPPQYQDILPDSAIELPPVKWSIRLNDKSIGEATNQIERQEDGQANATSTVWIKELSVDELIGQRLGGLGGAIFQRFQPLSPSGGAGDALSFQVRNEMQFDHFGELTGFDCIVDVADFPECIILRGTVANEKLKLLAYVTIPSADGKPATRQPVHKSEMDLPAGSLIADSLSPRPRFRDLYVGQEWTFSTYRPLAPNSPLQDVLATVEALETIQWNGEPITAHRVAYQRPTGGVLNLDQQLGVVWVDPTGTVLRQTMNWGALRLTFERLADDGDSRLTAEEGHRDLDQ